MRLAGIVRKRDFTSAGVALFDLGSETYDVLTEFAEYPQLLSDNRRILFSDQHRLLVLDTQSRAYREILSVAPQELDFFGRPSRDDRTV